MEGFEKQCLIEMLKYKYRLASKKARGEILDELVERIGVGRRQARRFMEPKAVGSDNYNSRSK